LFIVVRHTICDAAVGEANWKLLLMSLFCRVAGELGRAEMCGSTFGGVNRFVSSPVDVGGIC
jgi:hypothetical protein